MAQRPGDGADQPVAAERDGDLAGLDRIASQRAGVLEAQRRLHVVLEPEPVQLGLHGGQRPAGASAAGDRIDDHRQPHPSTSSRRSSAIATGAGEERPAPRRGC